ncbi:MAG: hypothetical protein ACYCYP_03680, partial [Leptospirales bacterium]
VKFGHRFLLVVNRLFAQRPFSGRSMAFSILSQRNLQHYMDSTLKGKRPLHKSPWIKKIVYLFNRSTFNEKFNFGLFHHLHLLVLKMIPRQVFFLSIHDFWDMRGVDEI